MRTDLNVMVYEREGHTRVAAVEADRILSIVGNEGLESTARRVREDLGRVVAGIARS
jgi:hypothetical protein